MMKHLVLLALVGIVFSQDEPNCAKCKDQYKYVCKHPNITKMCDGDDAYAGLINLKCPLTCGTCTPCSVDISPRSCLPGSYKCEDSSRICRYFKFFNLCNQGPWFFLVQDKCKKTCETCKPKHCRNAVSSRNLKPQCSDDCVDQINGCKSLAESNLCHFKKDVRERCPLSCGTCTPCKKEQTEVTIELNQGPAPEEDNVLSMMAKMTKPKRAPTESP